MEDSEFTAETARGDTSADEVASLTNVFQILGGISAIVVSSSILMLFSVASYWVRVALLGADPVQAQYTSVLDISVSILLTLGLTAVFLVAIYSVLPVTLDQMYDSLVQGAGLLLLVYPFMTVRAMMTYDIPATIALGIETPFWFVYSIVGVLFLIQPKMRRSNHAARGPRQVAPALAFSLSLSIAALTFFQISEVVISGTLYSLLLIASPIVAAISAIMYALLPEKHGTGASVLS